MEKVENPKAKRLRITLCVLFIVNIFCLEMPFVALQDGKVYYQRTALEVISFLTADRWQALGATYLVFLILPIVGLLFAIFDKKRNIKCAVAILCSVAGVIAITMMIGLYLSIGSLISIFVYLIIIVLSVSLFMTNMASMHDDPTLNNTKEAPRRLG